MSVPRRSSSVYTKPTSREEALLKATEILVEIIRSDVESDIPLIGFVNNPYLASEDQLFLILSEMKGAADAARARLNARASKPIKRN